MASRRPGRPRGERADQAIIDAALSLFAESGPEGLCIERVAARAGVGKATIYRRWPGKEDLLLDAIAALKAPLPEARPVGPGGPGDAARRPCARRAPTRAGPGSSRCCWGRAQSTRGWWTRYVETVLEPRREVVRAVLRRGMATGELRPDLDVEAALFMLVGAVVARRGHERRQIPAGYAERVVDELLRGLGAR